jgi:hypothetical protein
MVRCPVLDTGRNSVRPSTMPRSRASNRFIAVVLVGRWVGHRTEAGPPDNIGGGAGIRNGAHAGQAPSTAVGLGP